MTAYVPLYQLTGAAGEHGFHTRDRLCRLGFLAGGRPTIRAFVHRVAKKFPYGNREGGASHFYGWSADLLAPYLREELR
jgi:hypothetical protein